jgi:outer membrane receptor protein involved in Fe transport
MADRWIWRVVVTFGAWLLSSQRALAQEVGGPVGVSPTDESTVFGSAPMSAASSQVVRDRDLQLRPRMRPADIFEVAPGLIVVQHAGGGKANQYFLRGFDADHGTDLALSLDDVPINMVTHGHGQGYADPHFIIPELIERVEVREGPFFAQDGDFATAGAINLRLREAVERSSVMLEDSLVANPALGVGMLSNPRFLGILRTDAGPVRGYLAAEFAHLDGPFLNPVNFNHVNVVGRWGLNLGTSANIALTAMSYTGAWNASGQIPTRLVGQPYEGRVFDQFDSVDPSEGGQSERHMVQAAFRARVGSGSELRLMAYAATYRLAIYSNFTFFLEDPVHGDQIEQTDARLMTGFRATWRNTATAGAWRFVTTAGATLRHDDIDNGLHHTVQRQRLEDRVVDSVQETALGVFAEEQVIPNRNVRFVLGLRADTFSFGVADTRPGVVVPDPSRNGVRQAQVLSPKATLVVSPVRGRNLDLDLYANFGRGFHSNDGRGTIISPSAALIMQCADPLRVPSGTRCPVSPLTVATGYELGVRARLFGSIDLSVAGWLLDLDQETVWVGDEGTTDVAGATRRLGLTIEARVQILRWLWADADVSFVNAVYRRGGAVALAPPFVLAAGLSARHPRGFFGAIRLRMIADRPADPDNNLHAQGFSIFSAQVGYRHAWYEVAALAENLLDATWREAQFEGDSRLRGEPSECSATNPRCHTDIKYTAGTPFTATLRFTVSWR